MRITVKQAAERAGVSAGMVYQWVGERRLPVFRLGGKGKRGKILIEDGDLTTFLDTLRVGADGGRLAPTPPPVPAPLTPPTPPRLRHVRVRP